MDKYFIKPLYENLIDSLPERIDALKHIHTHIHKEMQELRGTMLKMLTAVTGMFVVILGWLIMKRAELTLSGYLAMAGGVLMLMVVLNRSTYILSQYFRDVGEILNKIEKVLRVYEPDVYTTHNWDWPSRTLYPEHWKTLGTEEWKEPIFDLSRFIVILFGTYILLTILFFIICDFHSIFIHTIWDVYIANNTVYHNIQLLLTGGYRNE